MNLNEISAWAVRLVAAIGLVAGVVASAQQPAPGTQTQPSIASAVRPDYVLGPNDQITIRSAQVAEINDRPFRIDSDGFVELPIVGKVRAGGLTIQAFELELTTRLREFVREPQVFVSLAQLRSEPVFLVGAFRVPGIYPLQGRRTLVEMLTLAGGTQPYASRRVKVTRRAEYGPLPLPNAIEDQQKKLSTVEISLDSLTQNINPEEDILLQPYDIISVDRAEKVYVTGEVGKGLGIEMGERTSITIAQALTEAGGLTQYSKNDKIRVLRPISGTNRRAEILIDANKVFSGKAEDFPLLPNDVLYIPRSASRALVTQAGTTALVSLPYLIVTLLANRNN